MILHRSASRKQPIVQAALIGAKNLCQRHTLEHPQPGADRSNLLTNRSKAAFGPKAPIQDPIRQFRRQARPQRDRRCGRSAILPVRFVRMRPRVTSCFPRRRVKLRIFESETERCWPRIRRWTLFRIDRQPGSGLFLSRFLRCSLNLAADISTGNLDADLVRNLDCQR